MTPKPKRKRIDTRRGRVRPSKKKGIAPEKLQHLAAFWHKTRREFVPLLGEEWEAKSEGLTYRIRGKLSFFGYVTAEMVGENIRFYEITDAGRAVVEAEGAEA